MKPWTWIVVLLMTIGCAAKQSTSAYRSVSADYDDYAASELAAAPPSAEPSFAQRSVLAEEPPSVTIQPVAPQRMVHYDGYARLRATRPTETLDRIASLSVDVGGRVDRLSDNQATVRVPVDRFDEVWKAVLELGDVLDKQVRADDVTDQFRATDLRVRTLRTMRDRLVKLLGRARTEQEKLALLEQLTRVTEELDRTDSQLRTLRDLASMSRINVSVLPREIGPQRGALTLSGFEWINALSPFNRSVYDDDKRLALVTPEEMVDRTRRGPYIAESPDGTVLWTIRIANDPRGDAEFWRRAMGEALADDFEGVQTRDVGGWACTTFDEPGSDEPYRWQVCLATSGRHLEVVQAYFPGPQQVTRFADRIDAALAGGHAGGDS